MICILEDVIPLLVSVIKCPACRLSVVIDSYMQPIFEAPVGIGQRRNLVFQKHEW